MKHTCILRCTSVGVSVGEMIEKAGGIDGKYGETIMGGATESLLALDAPTTKTTGAILVTVEFPDLHGATMGILDSFTWKRRAYA